MSYSERLKFAHAHQVFDTEAMWGLLTNTTSCDCDCDCITFEVVQSMLYHMLFRKKHFANAVATDVMLSR